MYLSRGYRKRSELYHIQAERKKKGLCTEKVAWQDPETTVGAGNDSSYSFNLPPGLWEMLIVSCSRHALVYVHLLRRDP